LRVAEAEFLAIHGDCWTGRQAREFSVVNVHAMEIPAPVARIFPQLGARDLLAHGAFWKFLLGFRLGIGKIFGWDRGLAVNQPQALEVGKYFGWFHVIYVDAPWEAGMTVENQLTRAMMSWVLRENAGGTTVFNVTCADFKGRGGRIYWQVIRPFHDGLVEDSLRTLRRRAERR
jgi:uncharacterized protein DUF2867